MSCYRRPAALASDRHLALWQLLPPSVVGSEGVSPGPPHFARWATLMGRRTGGTNWRPAQMSSNIPCSSRILRLMDGPGAAAPSAGNRLSSFHPSRLRILLQRAGESYSRPSCVLAQFCVNRSSDFPTRPVTFSRNYPATTRRKKSSCSVLGSIGFFPGPQPPPAGAEDHRRFCLLSVGTPASKLKAHDFLIQSPAPRLRDQGSWTSFAWIVGEGPGTPGFWENQIKELGVERPCFYLKSVNVSRTELAKLLPTIADLGRP